MVARAVSAPALFPAVTLMALILPETLALTSWPSALAISSSTCFCLASMAFLEFCRSRLAVSPQRGFKDLVLQSRLGGFDRFRGGGGRSIFIYQRLLIFCCALCKPQRHLQNGLPNFLLFDFYLRSLAFIFLLLFLTLYLLILRFHICNLFRK